MPQSSYAYAVGRVRVLENKLLSRDKIERMLDTVSLEDAIKVLMENEYGLGRELDSPYNYETLLFDELKKTYQLIDTITPDKSATDLFLLQYDIHNLKVLIKARFLEGAQDNLLIDLGTIPLNKLTVYLEDKDYDELPEFLKDALINLDNVLSLQVDPHKIDVILDQAYYSWVFKVCSRRRNSFLLEYFTKKVDLLNIKTLLRVKKIGEDYDFLRNLIIPYGTFDSEFFSQSLDTSLDQLIYDTRNTEYAHVLTEGIQVFIKDKSLTVYERLTDNYLLNFVKSRKNNPFGIEAVVGYLLAKENELKVVRIIMVGKANRISRDRIQERLRDLYV